MQQHQNHLKLPFPAMPSLLVKYFLGEANHRNLLRSSWLSTRSKCFWQDRARFQVAKVLSLSSQQCLRWSWWRGQWHQVRHLQGRGEADAEALLPRIRLLIFRSEFGFADKGKISLDHTWANNSTRYHYSKITWKSGSIRGRIPGRIRGNDSTRVIFK